MPTRMKAERPKRKTREEKLTDARMKFYSLLNASTYDVRTLAEGLDYAFFELGLIISEIQDAKETRTVTVSVEDLADAIAKDLFTSGRDSKPAERLLLERNGEDLGGWTINAVRERILSHLRGDQR